MGAACHCCQGPTQQIWGSHCLEVIGAGLTGKIIVDDFQREVDFLASIDNPNIVQCYGRITHKDGVCVMWIIMEKLDFTLLEVIKDKHLKIGRDDPQTYVGWVADIFNDLGYLHSPVDGKSIVHRDLKPKNIMIQSLKEPLVKLIDFDMVKETITCMGSTMNIKGYYERNTSSPLPLRTSDL